ncbi:MAG: hypothetical protein GYA14_00140 [Ignavibacteria bacterium]|nr:hypothetical protein [Ignavibacteria bacterium]
MKLNLALIFFLITALFSGCKRSEESDWFSGDFYNNDKDKISSDMVDENLGCKFNPPLSWSLQSAELSKKIESKNKFQDAGQNTFSYLPVYLFFNQQTGSLLSIGLVEYSDSTATIESKLSSYKNLITNKYRNDKLSLGAFTKSGIKFNQIKSEKENFVNYKVIFYNTAKKIIQLDCTIRKDYLKTEIEFLKATIGSIQLLKPI